jgi:hypothetical protein
MTDKVKKNWMEQFYEGEKSTQANKRRKTKVMCTRCEACNAVLDQFQMEYGLCGTCDKSIKSAASSNNIAADKYFMEHEMWRNPLGSSEEEASAVTRGEHYDDNG